MPRTEHHYYLAGKVERGANYEWRPGYSRVTDTGGSTQPWLTKREAQRQARSEGAKARFHDTEESARDAVLNRKATPHD